MAIQMSCPQCQKRLLVPTELAGRRVRCPCGVAFDVPRMGAPATAKPPRTAKPAPPPGLTPERAEAIVREVAEQLKAQKNLQKLGKVSASALSKARASFAGGLSDDETPLLMVDRSFLQNGSSGLLLTNKRLYSSLLGEPVALEDVVVVTGETPTQVRIFVAQMLGILALFMRDKLKPRLLINGCEVDRGPLATKFWTEALTRLGREARGSAGRTRAVFKGEELARLVTAAVARGKSADESVTEIAAAGVDAAKAAPLAAELVAVRDRPRYGTTIVLLGVGMLLALLGLAGTGARIGDQEVLLWFGPIIFGLGLLGAGVYRLFKGPPPLTVEELWNAWGASPGPGRGGTTAVLTWMVGVVAVLVLGGAIIATVLGVVDRFDLAPNEVMNTDGEGGGSVAAPPHWSEEEKTAPEPRPKIP